MPPFPLPDQPVDEYTPDPWRRDPDPRITCVEADADGPNVFAVAVLLALAMLLLSGLALLAAWLLW
jgi:hypothetical protein